MRYSYFFLVCVVLFAACGTSDTTPPAPPIVDSIQSPTPVTTIDVTGTAEFGSTVNVKLNGGSSATTIADPYTARWFAKVTLTSGTNQLQVTAEDEAGNVSDPTTVEITQGSLGTIAPFTMVLQLAQPSAFVGIPLGFSVIAVDARGNAADQATLAITTTDTTASVSIPNHAITFNTPGTPAQTVTATLFGGTADEVSASVVVFVSAITTLPPTVVITSPTNNVTFSDDFTVIVTASDSAGLAQIFLQGTGAVDTFQQQLVPLDSATGKPPVGPFNAVFTVPVRGGAIGPATLIAQATDTFGNAMTSLAVTVNIDPAGAITVANGVTITTISARGFLRRPQGVAVDAANLVYVTNNDSNFPLVVKIDPAGPVLANQTAFITAQPGRDGEDIVFSGAGTPAFFISTSNTDRIARVDAAGTNLLLGWSADVGAAPFGLVVESATSIAALYDDRIVRRFNSTSAGPNTASSSSMNVSTNLGGSWGLEVLNLGCRANQFRCGNGNCITNNLACNNTDNCGDNTDEGATTCASNGVFKCVAGGVVSTSVGNICSGQAQCADGSDEAGCSRYVASDAGVNDETFAFYDGGNAAPTAFDLQLDAARSFPDARGIAKSPSGAFVYVASRGGNAIFQVRSSDILARTPCVGGCPTVATGFDEAYGLVFANNGDLIVTDRATDLVYRLAGLP